ncbi:MAG: M56 family metallopeptidase [Pseudomonadota bacterium]
MTAMKPVLDLVIDANVVFVLAFCFWSMTHAVIGRSRLASDFALQLRLLRTVLAFVVLSPILSYLAMVLSQTLWPRAPITASDVAVAVYLRGNIDLSAIRFEELLDTRDRVTDMVIAGDVPWLTALFGLVGFGVAYLTLKMVLTIRQVNRIVSQSYTWRRTRTTDIRLSDTVTIPFAARGIWRRHVVLPSYLLTKPRELRIVLAHEFEHLRQSDVEWELIFEFVRPFLFWNPAFLLWRRAFDRLRELSCDQAVIASKRISPREYAQCLLEFCERKPTKRTVEVFNVAFLRTGTSVARQALEARVIALGDVRRRDGQNRALQCFVSGFLAIAIVVTAASVRSPGDWSHDRLMLSTIVNLERLEAINASFGVRP